MAQLAAVCNTSFGSAEQAVQQIGSGFPVASLTELPKVNLTFITTPDDLIPSIALQLKEQVPVDCFVVHCSGVLSSAELMPLKTRGCHIASIHPLKAFSKANLDQHAFTHCDCVIEGDQLAVELLTSLFTKLGARIIPIKAGGKTIYHAAAVIASNYLVTLAATANDLLQEAGIEAKLAQQMIVNLMASSLNNVQQATAIKKALTGPLARGDLNTINRHLKALDNCFADELYRHAALATLPITDLDTELKSALTVLLQKAI
ncbi:Rossmann-like and DUF2520 domain-containing protein [Legionella tunisiensis]|uniref:Rossmann-like and DUF2520 domain-containing protein n=1 Tax=Legionella tunisiensis TaxID=1034944 RepID=UPI0002FBDB62|nr:DUF2520 domain-containing protein [Legionella tunisiensis]